MDDPNLHDSARDYLDAGLSVLRADRKAKKPSVGEWKRYQKRLPTAAEVDAWFSNGHDAMCIVAGTVSGHLEMIDFDHGGELFEPWCERIPGDLLARLVIEETQSGGWHVVYRCEIPVSGNLKLAQRKHMVAPEEVFIKDGREYVRIRGKDYLVLVDSNGERYAIITLIETRGEGGIFLCAPTPGYELMQGELKKVIHLRSQRRYDPALAAVNEILQKDPEFTQAGLIKARILAEGFDDLDGALMQLKRILAKSPKDDPTSAQARRLYAELSTFKEFGG